MIVAALLAGAVPAAGQEPELVTDRPDQTESARTVPAETLQVELGAFASRDRQDVARTEVREAPGVLLRWGAASRLELRLAWPGEVEVETRRSGVAQPSREVERGTGDPELGFKAALLAPERGDRFELALLGHLSLPLGDEPIGAPRANPSLRLTAAHALGARGGLGWNLGVETSSGPDGRGGERTLSRWVYTVVAGLDLGARWGVFAELFGDLPASDPAPTTHSLDGGVTFRATPRCQLDLAAGIALSGDAPDRFVGVGLSLRVPR